MDKDIRIARFIGFKRETYSHPVTKSWYLESQKLRLYKLDFSTNWNSLMACVKELNGMGWSMTLTDNCNYQPLKGDKYIVSFSPPQGLNLYEVYSTTGDGESIEVLYNALCKLIDYLKPP